MWVKISCPPLYPGSETRPPRGRRRANGSVRDLAFALNTSMCDKNAGLTIQTEAVTYGNYDDPWAPRPRVRAMCGVRLLPVPQRKSTPHQVVNARARKLEQYLCYMSMCNAYASKNLDHTGFEERVRRIAARMALLACAGAARLHFVFMTCATLELNYPRAAAQLLYH